MLFAGISGMSLEEWELRSVEDLHPESHDYAVEAVAQEPDGRIVLWNRAGVPVEVKPAEFLVLRAMINREVETWTWKRVEVLAHAAHKVEDESARRELLSLLADGLSLVAPTRYEWSRRSDDPLNQIPAIIWTTDAQLRLRTVGGGDLPEQWAALEGKSVVEIFKELGADGETAVAAVERVLEGGIPILSYDLKIWGTRYSCHVRPIRNTKGKVTGSAGFAFAVRTDEPWDPSPGRAERFAAAFK